MGANRVDEGGPGGLKGFLLFLPGGALRLFGPLFLAAVLQPVGLRFMPEPQYGWVMFGVFLVGFYLTILHKRKYT